MTGRDRENERRRVEVSPTRRGDGEVDVLRIDGEPVKYGRLFDGSYFLFENAYVWGEDLNELGVELVRYRTDAATRARKRRER